MKQSHFYNLHPLLEVQPPNANLHSFDARIFPTLPDQFTHITVPSNVREVKFVESGRPLPFTQETLEKLRHVLDTEKTYELTACPLSIDNLIVQATTLRNTDYIVGVAVYTGTETKVSCNKSKPPTKITQFERLFSLMTMVIFGIQLVFVLIFAICLLLLSLSITDTS